MALVNSLSQLDVSDDLLHLAAQIVRDRQSSDGALRTAISRAYYAVFIIARDRLFGPDGKGLTSKVRNRLKSKFARKAKGGLGNHDVIILAITDLQKTRALNPISLSQQLQQLKEARVYADYFFTSEKLKAIPYGNWYEYADANVALASQLLPLVRRLTSYP